VFLPICEVFALFNDYSKTKTFSLKLMIETIEKLFVVKFRRKVKHF